MKKIILLLIPLLFLLSCGKDNESSGSFTWNYDGTNYTANFKAAYSSSMGQPYIIGGLGNSITTPNSGPHIYVISFTPGTYSFGGIVPNSLNFVDQLGFDISAIGGAVNITSNSNNKLSGNFSAALANGKTVTGSFTDLTILQ
jgi:hypothetical protein